MQYYLSEFSWHLGCLKTFSEIDSHPQLSLEPTVGEQRLGKIITIDLETHEVETEKFNDLAKEKLLRSNRSLKTATELMHGGHYTKFFFIDRILATNPNKIQFKRTSHGIAQLTPGNKDSNVRPKLNLLRFDAVKQSFTVTKIGFASLD